MFWHRIYSGHTQLLKKFYTDLEHFTIHQQTKKRMTDACMHQTSKTKQKDRKMKEVTIKVLVRKLYESLSEQISAVI